jgi:hypothetical protein
MYHSNGADPDRVGFRIRTIARALIAALIVTCLAGEACAAPKPRMRGKIQNVIQPRYDPLTPSTIPTSVPVAVAPTSLPTGTFGTSTIPGSSLICRQQCNRAYYFCLSNDGSEDCAARWVPCTSTCATQARTAP